MNTRVIRNFLIICSLFAVSFSCNSDDTDRRPRVVYQIAASSDIISTIDFKGFNGQQATVSESAAVPGWSQQVLVNLPFTAVLNAGLANNGAAPADYALRISVNDSLVGEKTGTIEAGAILAETLSVNAAQ